LLAQRLDVRLGARDQQHEVVRVADQAPVAQAMAATPLPRREGRAGTCPDLGGMLVEGRQRDIAEQWGEDPPLWGAGDGVSLGAALGEDAGLQERLEQNQGGV